MFFRPLYFNKPKSYITSLGNYFFVIYIATIILIFKLYHVQNISPNVLGKNTTKNDYKKIASDQEPPTISTNKINVTTEDKSEIIYLTSNEKLKYYQLSEEFKINFQGKTQQGNYLYSLSIPSSHTASAYKLLFFDEVGNKKDLFLFANINKLILPDNLDSCQTINYQSMNLYTLPIGKIHCIDENFENMLKLVDFKDGNLTYKVNQIIIDDLQNLLEDARRDQIIISINSAYRSLKRQDKLRDDLLKYYGEEIGEKIVAIPGQSEHNIGTAIDFTSQEYNAGKKLKFKDTSAYKWLQENAWKYGFVQSYPENKEKITGFEFEAWHWRYVGKQHSSNIRLLEDITLTEYLYLVNLIEDSK
ncbi:hypothetical protein GF362_06255 [Candidatus Dojkabacteria bacterium]|nr:hypothetical protein [Candidatus Dojkabacteria bacterium]